MSHKYFFHYTLSTIHIQKRISGPKRSELTQVWNYMLIYFTSPRSNLRVSPNGSVTIHLSHGTTSLNWVGESFFKCLSRNYSWNVKAHITVFTRTWYVSGLYQIQFMSSQPIFKIHYNTVCKSISRTSKWSLPIRFCK